MSILIRGVDMPKNCFDCPCYHHKVDDGYYDYEICRASGTVFNDGYSSVTGHKDHINPFKARLDNCPLVEIPPHGRLIEESKVLDIVSEWCPDDDGSVGKVGDLREMLDEIEALPTIIEAEEGE